MKNIASAFVKAQKGFAPALKSSTNPHFKSRYADLAACVEAVIDSLNDNGIGLIQRTSEDSTGVTVETVFIHESGEMLECGKLHVPAAKQDPQGYGSALTYARRYALMAACGIAPEDDDGNAASKPKAKPPAPVIRPIGNPEENVTAEEQAYLRELASRLTDMVDAGSGPVAAEALKGENLEEPQKLFIWSLLPSHVRSAIKKG
jgi:hypothetical protein